MAKEKDCASPASGEGDIKMKALGDAIAAVAPLDRTARVDVLRAVANYYGITTVLESPR